MRNSLMTNPTPQEPYTKPPTHYVDNKKFLAELIEYRKTVLAAKDVGENIPPINNYIGECFLKISTHLSYKANFINYSYRDEMISDAVENCLTCVSNFDPNISANPFAYFTQVCFYAFIRRIQKEQKETKTKMKIIQNMNIDDIITQEMGSNDLNNEFLDYLRRNMLNIPEAVNIKPETKRKIASKQGTLPIDIE